MFVSMKKKKHYSARELARLVGCAPSTITRAISSGVIKAESVEGVLWWLIPVKEAEKYMKARAIMRGEA